MRVATLHKSRYATDPEWLCAVEMLKKSPEDISGSLSKISCVRRDTAQVAIRHRSKKALRRRDAEQESGRYFRISVQDFLRASRHCISRDTSQIHKLFAIEMLSAREANTAVERLRPSTSNR